MRNLLYIVFFCGFVNLQGQTSNMEFFSGNSFSATHYITDDLEIDASCEKDFPADEGGNVTIQIFNKISFHSSEDNVQVGDVMIKADFFVELGNSQGNGRTVYYKYHETYFEVLGGGTQTLGNSFCNEELIFTPLAGGGLSSYPYRVYYTIDNDKKGFRAYSEENPGHIIVFKLPATAGVKKLEIEESIHIIPDANTKILTVKTLKATILEVAVFDALGKKGLVKKNDFTNISTANLAKGIYLVKVKSDKVNMTKQVIIR